MIEDYVYDELNRLDLLTHYAPDETPETLADNDKLTEFDYEVRADGQRTGVTETYWLDQNQDGTPEAKTVDIDWTYDALGRLTQESIDHFDNQFDQTEWFEYDLVGNRTKKELDSDFNGTVDEAIAYLYDANDRLTTEERDADNNSTVDETTTYAYDHTQQTSKTVFDNTASQNTSQTTFAYDLQGRLNVATVTTYTSGNESRIEKTTYTYDADGIRVSALSQIDTDANGSWDETTNTEYLVDHQNFTGYQQVIKETVYDENGNVVKVIEYNFGHDEISQTVTEYSGGVPGTPETHIFGHDGHGSVKVLYDAAAAIAQVYTYEAYGQMLAIHNAIAGVVTTGALTSLQYSGEQFDSRIGQQYLRARYYDPNTGRFNRLDPFAGNSEDPQSFHKYLYTHGNPVMGVDPTGLEFTISGLLGSMGAGSNARAQNQAAQQSGKRYAKKVVKEVWEEIYDSMNLAEPTDPHQRRIAAAGEKLWVRRLGKLGWIPIPLQSTPIGSHGPDMVAVSVDLKNKKVKVLIGEIKALSSPKVLAALDRKLDNSIQMSINWLKPHLEMLASGILTALTNALGYALQSTNLPGASKFVENAIKSGDIDLYLLRARHYGSGDFKLRGYKLLNMRASNGRVLSHNDVARAKTDKSDPIQEEYPKSGYEKMSFY